MTNFEIDILQTYFANIYRYFVYFFSLSKYVNSINVVSELA